MLVAAPAIAALDLVLAPVMGKAPFSFETGNAANGGITLFLMSLYALLVGGMSQMREFVCSRSASSSSTRHGRPPT